MGINLYFILCNSWVIMSFHKDIDLGMVNQAIIMFHRGDISLNYLGLPMGTQ